MHLVYMHLCAARFVVNEIFFFIEQTSKQAASNKTYNLTRIIRKKTKQIYLQLIKKKKKTQQFRRQQEKKCAHMTV